MDTFPNMAVIPLLEGRGSLFYTSKERFGENLERGRNYFLTLC